MSVQFLACELFAGKDVSEQYPLDLATSGKAIHILPIRFDLIEGKAYLVDVGNRQQCREIFFRSSVEGFKRSGRGAVYAALDAFAAGHRSRAGWKTRVL